ncbi:MAG TPA: hypothetical protein VFJ47_01225 [Terriglobales bacterium]|nr:hypothetical protein [Terriglobales bacterium]
MRTTALLILTCILMSCSDASKAPGGAPAASPESRIEAIPAADPSKYSHVRDYRSWRNPYLIVRADGVALADFQNNEEHILKPEELTSALAKLPAAAWPYGRVVAVAENVVRNGSQEEEIAIRRNRGIVAGTLESMHVLINWIPPA